MLIPSKNIMLVTAPLPIPLMAISRTVFTQPQGLGEP